MTSFMISKRSFATLTFDYENSVEEFEVEITGGEVKDSSNVVNLSNETYQDYFFEDAHQIAQNPLGTFILHGSLSKLQKKIFRKRNDQEQDYLLHLTSLHKTKVETQRTDIGVSSEREV